MQSLVCCTLETKLSQTFPIGTLEKEGTKGTTLEWERNWLDREARQGDGIRENTERKGEEVNRGIEGRKKRGEKRRGEEGENRGEQGRRGETKEEQGRTREAGVACPR